MGPRWRSPVPVDWYSFGLGFRHDFDGRSDDMGCFRFTIQRCHEASNVMYTQHETIEDLRNPRTFRFSRSSALRP